MIRCFHLVKGNKDEISLKTSEYEYYLINDKHN